MIGIPPNLNGIGIGPGPAGPLRGSGPARDASGPPTRIALYSHDTQGLGHIRRNMLITRALCRRGVNPIILLMSGLREATAFALPPGVGCLTLPALGKGKDGKYFARSLGVPMNDLIDIRRRSIASALKSFNPDVLIVDKVPLGAFDELRPTLEVLSAGGTQIVLGLREILDDPETVRREWTKGRYHKAIRRYYQQIWVYGDRAVYDTVDEYDFPADLARMVRYTGYLNPRDADDDPVRAPAHAPGRDANGRRMLCVVGGGRDGMPLAEAFLRSELPPGARGTLVTGPLMPPDALGRFRAMAAHRGIELVEFVTDPCPLLEAADMVIAMGGYNTTCEILAYRKPALIVPRVRPRTEQLMRASRLAGLRLLDMLHPDGLSADALTAWMARPRGWLRPASGIIDFEGVRRLPVLLDELVADADRAALGRVSS